MWSTAFMSEEVKASVRRSREGAVHLIEEHAQGGRTRTAFCAQHGLSTGMQGLYRELHGSSLPVAESRVLPVGRFPDTVAPTSTEATTGWSLWVDLRHGRRTDAGRGWLCGEALTEFLHRPAAAPRGKPV
jgi:hypothetical protein